jgi:CO/xanthine dehydrogenase Mo-binding subunit
MTRDLLTDEPIEDERYELLTGPYYDFTHNRREFVGVLGAGILIAVTAPHAIAQQSEGRPGGFDRGGQNAKIADRLHIGVDGTVTVLTGKVEIGQGARTQVCQAAAEELRLQPANVHVIMGDTELCPNDGGTSGSGTTPRTIPSIRAAAAVARRVLVELAAEKLHADASSLNVQDGRIVDPKSNRSLSYAELAKDETLKSKLDRVVGSDVSIVLAERWQVLGTSPGKTGAEQIVTGSHRYPSDIVRPGMRYGRILRRPTYGARLVSIDLRPAEAMPGVIVVRDGEFVGCAAKSTWLATKAIEALAPTVKWEQSEASQQPASDALFKYLKDHAAPQQAGGGRGFGRNGGTSRGSVEQGLALAKKTLNAAYEVAYIQHAPMEPRAAVAQWQEGKLTVWTGTQNPARVRGELMQAFRLPTERVRVIVPDAGGGFGGKHTGEVALEAARLAKRCGQPVSVRWTREEEFVWAYFRPAGLIEVTGGLDSKGGLLVWTFTNYNSGGSALETPYHVPNVRTQFISCDAPLRAGSYRALASTANTFARECFLDELAEVADADPLSFRLAHLAAGRLRDVLLAATEKFDWSGRWKKHGSGRGVGLACGTEKGSYVAACAEIEIDRRTGTVKVHRICQAFECGAIQNPENLRAQVQGCVIMGLGAALRERIDFAGGKIRNASFSEYLVPRMDDVPTIETVLVNRRDLPSAGAGETPIIAVAPAIANAVFHATAIRIRAMPMPTELLKQGSRSTERT